MLVSPGIHGKGLNISIPVFKVGFRVGPSIRVSCRSAVRKVKGHRPFQHGPSDADLMICEGQTVYSVFVSRTTTHIGTMRSAIVHGY